MKTDLSVNLGDVKVNILMLVLMNENGFSMLPEIFDVFGEEKLLMFMDIFSGTTIKIPDQTALKKSIQEVTIYSLMESGKYSSPESLASQFEMPASQIRQTHAKIKSVVDNHNVNLSKVVR